MAVNVSGTVLASLFYENCSSHGDQVGFLIGEIVRHVKDTISDSQINNVEVNTRIYVFECVACPRDELFYNVWGEVGQQKITSLLPEKHQNIIGWYSFRRNSTMRPSFRERQLHQNLAGLLAEQPHMFPFLLCSAKASTNKSTHTLDHCFLHLENNMFKKMPVEIINLGDTTHAEYRSTPRHTVAGKQGAFSKIVQQQEEQFLNSYGQMEVHQIQALNGAISRQLDELAESVIKSEARRSDLELEVLQYRRRVKQKQLESQHQNQLLHTSAKVKKGPSLDEILRMDETENAPCLLELTRPVHSLKGHDGATKASQDIYIKQEKYITEMTNSGAGDLDSQLKKVHLTPAVNVHTRSASTPVEMDSACAQVRHTRSKSSDDSSELSDTQPKNRQGDSFDFVGDMLAQSKSKDKRSRKTDKPCSDIVNDLKETGHSVRGSQKHTAAAKLAAQSLNQNTRTGQKLNGQGLRSGKTTNQDEDSDGGTCVDDKVDLHEKRDLRKTNNPQKTVGRGTRIKREKIVIDTDNSSSSSSPDTYEMESMESSASPVY